MTKIYLKNENVSCIVSFYNKIDSSKVCVYVYTMYLYFGLVGHRQSKLFFIYTLALGE